MAFRWLISRIVRLVGQKVNSLFYMLVYREIQAEIANIAAEIGVEPAELSKEIGRRAARESAERHASILGLVPVNPKNTKKIVQYIETLWYILFGSKLEDYEIEAEELPDGNQKVTFFIKKCPVCMGHEDDKGQFEEAYNAFKKKESEGYACLMAGMLEELARIIMENKNMDIRMDIREVQCFARGDKIMAVEATVIPAEQYDNRKGIAFEITKGREDIPVGDDQGVSMESIASESTKLFEKIAETLKIEEIDEFFDTPVDSLKEQIEEFVEGKLHFTPKEILEYFRNYEEDVFKVIGYLAIHALNEAGGIISMICSNFILSRILDIIISAFEYGLDTFIPDKVLQDQKEIVVKFMDGWAQDESVVEFKKMGARDYLKNVLDGMRIAFMDYGAEFVGAKEATFTLLKKTSLIKEEEPSRAFNLLFDVFQEASLLAGYILAIPLKVLFASSYESVRTPVTSIQEVYQSGRDHFEKLFDLIEELQDVDFGIDDEKLNSEFRKNFPRVF